MEGPSWDRGPVSPLRRTGPVRQEPGLGLRKHTPGRLGAPGGGRTCQGQRRFYCRPSVLPGGSSPRESGGVPRWGLRPCRRQSRAWGGPSPRVRAFPPRISPRTGRSGGTRSAAPTPSTSRRFITERGPGLHTFPGAWLTQEGGVLDVDSFYSVCLS